MKILIAFLLLTSSVQVYSQEQAMYIGAPKGAVKVQGRLYVDSLFQLPKRDTSLNKPLRNAAIAMHTDNRYYLWDSIVNKWIPIASYVDSSLTINNNITIINNPVTLDSVQSVGRDTIRGKPRLIPFPVIKKYVLNGISLTTLGSGASTWDPTTGVLNIPIPIVYTDEMSQDATASLIQSGTGISWSYNDASNTLTPTVTLSPFSTTNLSEGSNLYYTDGRARSAISLTTTGTSGASTYNSSTGVINIPQYTGNTYTASNGLTMSSNDTKLGGSLSQFTTVSQGSNSLQFTSTTGFFLSSNTVSGLTNQIYNWQYYAELRSKRPGGSNNYIQASEYSNYILSADSLYNASATNGLRGVITTQAGSVVMESSKLGVNGHSIVILNDKITFGKQSSLIAIYINDLPIYADEAAAVAGGLTTDRVYMTSTGELRIKL